MPATNRTDPRIYTILDFHPAAPGTLTYRCHYVAAFSTQDAQRRFLAAGLSGTELYIVTDEALDGVSEPMRALKADAHQARFDTVTPEAHAAWVRAMTNGHHESGQYYGPGWQRFYPTAPSILRSA